MEDASTPTIEEREASFWLYPTNYEVRQYQASITQTCLFSNTLVCLPTGLGKTLISAVVMHAFYRWYPTGIVVFMAPTKPLVAQQIKACYDVMGIPTSDTAQIEGTLAGERRRDLWRSRRMIFCTPQTMENDLRSGACPARRVVCVVVDEAHKATAGYAFTNVVRELETEGAKFRVLALSATPGSDAKKIQLVINNLRINSLEYRAEDDPEIAPYTFQRSIEIVKVPEGARNNVMSSLKSLVESMIAPVSSRLQRGGMIAHAAPSSTNIYTVEEAERSLSRELEHRSALFTNQMRMQVEADIRDLRHMIECRRLVGNTDLAGLRHLVQSMQGEGVGQVMSALAGTPQFRKISETLRRTQNDVSALTKSASKVAKLKEILAQHFRELSLAGASTRVIIFATLRNTVQQIVSEIGDVDGVRPHEFVGQATKSATSTAEAVKGLKQQRQQEVLTEFNRGAHNVLVATSIAEEGLDIAEVDLIVFFDIVASPVRMVQRMGRTGRKRDGRIVMLLAGAQEVDTYEKGQRASKSLSKIMQDPSMSKLTLKPHPDTMIPDYLPLPSMVQEAIDVPEFHLSQVGGNVVAAKGAVNRGISAAPSVTAASRGWRSGKPDPGVGTLSLHNYGAGVSVSRFTPGSTAIAASGGKNEGGITSYFQRETSQEPGPFLYSGRQAGESLSLGTLAARPPSRRHPHSSAYATAMASTDPILLEDDDGNESFELAFTTDSGRDSALNSSGKKAGKDKTQLRSISRVTPAATSSPLRGDQLHKACENCGTNCVSVDPSDTSDICESCSRAFAAADAALAVSMSTPAQPEIVEITGSQEDFVEESGRAIAQDLQVVPSKQLAIRHKPLSPSLARSRGLGTDAGQRGAQKGLHVHSQVQVRLEGPHRRSETAEVENNSNGIDAYAHASPGRKEYQRLKESMCTWRSERSKSSAPSIGTLAVLKDSMVQAPPFMRRQSRFMPVTDAVLAFVSEPSEGALVHCSRAPAPAPAPVHSQGPTSIGLGMFGLPTSQSDDSSEGGDEDDGDRDDGEEGECGDGDGVAHGEEIQDAATPAASCGATPAASHSTTKEIQDAAPPAASHSTTKPSVLPAFGLPDSQDSSSSDSDAEASDEGGSHGPVLEAGTRLAPSAQAHSAQAHSAQAHSAQAQPSAPTFAFSLPGSQSSQESRSSDEEGPDSLANELRADNVSCGLRCASITSISSSIGKISDSQPASMPPSVTKADGTDSDVVMTLDSENVEERLEGYVESKDATSAAFTAVDDEGVEDEDGHCCICLHADSFEDNPIIFCEGECGMAAHQHCLNLDRVPNGHFFCDGCEATKRNVYPPAKCTLCSKRGGLLLKAHSKHYFHPMCAVWTTELDLGDDGRSLQVGALDKERKSLVCSDCKQQGGAVVQCAYKRCLTGYHPNCAYRNHRLMVVWSAEPARFDVYCQEHAALAHVYGKDLKLPYYASNVAMPGTVSQRSQRSQRSQKRAQRDQEEDSPLLIDTQVSPEALHGGVEDSKEATNRQKWGNDKAPRGRKRLRKTGEDEEESVEWAEAQRRAFVRAHRRAQQRQSTKMAGKFFEEEASQSGSDSGDDEGGMCAVDMEGTGASPQLSGDFINDGEYTQPSTGFTQGDEKGSFSGASKKKKRRRNAVPQDGMAFYFHVNQDLGTPAPKPWSRRGAAASGEESGSDRGSDSDRDRGSDSRTQSAKRWSESSKGSYPSVASPVHFRGAEKGLPHIERILEREKMRGRQRGGTDITQEHTYAPSVSGTPSGTSEAFEQPEPASASGDPLSERQSQESCAGIGQIRRLAGMGADTTHDSESHHQHSSSDYGSHDTHRRLNEGGVASSPALPAESTDVCNMNGPGAAAVPRAQKRSKMPVTFTRRAERGILPPAARARASRPSSQGYGASLSSTVDADDEW